MENYQLFKSAPNLSACANVKMYDRSSEGLPFEPTQSQRDQMPLFKNNYVPRYLFRLHTAETAGETTTSHVIPPASLCGQTDRMRDIFRLPRADAAELLNSHFRWWRRHEPECNLISWTSSLLYVLQYGFYRHRIDNLNLAQIYLHVLDTRGFPEGTFIKDIEIMKVFDEYSKAGWKTLTDFFQLRKIGVYYFGEYLSQGKLSLKGCCVRTSMERMVDLGLFELRPELKDESEWNQWAKRVVSLRESLETSRLAHRVTQSELCRAFTIAQRCFGDRWVVPMAAMLLALKHRENNDPVIVDGFAARFTGK